MRRLAVTVLAVGGLLVVAVAGWALLWGMPLSAGALVVGWGLLAALFRGAPRWRYVLALAVAAPLFAWNVSLPEWARGSRRLSCRAQSALNPDSPMPSGWCDLDFAAYEGSGPIFGLRDRLAVDGFNLLMAAGGAPLFPEVAWETVMLVPGGVDHSHLPIAERRRWCSTAGAADGPLRQRESDFAMRSPTVQGAVAVLKAPGDSQPVRWRGAGSLDSTYTDILRHDSLRVALALYTPDARVEQRASDTGRLLVATAPIFYPTRALLQVRVPTAQGFVAVGLDEGMFCAMQADGAWQPYQVEWAWTDQPANSSP